MIYLFYDKNSKAEHKISASEKKWDKCNETKKLRPYTAIYQILRWKMKFSQSVYKEDTETV